MVAITACNTGTPQAHQNRLLLPFGEGGAGDDQRGVQPGKLGAQEGNRRWLPQAGHEDGHAQGALGGKGLGKGGHGGGVLGQPHRPVEDDGHHRARIIRAGWRAPEAGQWQDFGRLQFQRGAGMPRHAPQHAAQMRHPAGPEALQQRGTFLRRQGGECGQARVGTVLARQHGERDAARLAECRQLLGAIAPPIQPAEQPQHNDPRARSRAVQPEIHRHGVPQFPQRHQAQRGQ